MDPADVEPTCILLENLQQSGNLQPKLVGFTVEKLMTSIESKSKLLTMEHISNLYLTLSRVQEIYVNSQEPAAL